MIRDIFMGFSWFLGLLCILTIWNMGVKAHNADNKMEKTQAFSTFAITLMFLIYIILGIIITW